MSNKELKTRIQMKNDTAENWATASTNGFIPRLGEPIFYKEQDGEGFKFSMKIGDGVRTPDKLPAYAGNWNDLIDKPFGDETPAPIVWDGNTEGRDSIMGVFYKISDAIFTIDQLIGATVQRIYNGVITETVLDESHFIQIAEGCVMASDNGGPLFLSSSVTGTVDGTDIPSTGTFGALGKSGDWHTYLSCLMLPSKVKPLDEKYLPSISYVEFSDEAPCKLSVVDTADGSTMKGSFPYAVDENAVLTVTVDGVVYEEALNFSWREQIDGAYNYFAKVGNVYLSSGSSSNDSGEPFLLKIQTDDRQTYNWYFADEGKHTVSVSIAGTEIYHMASEKLIPNTIARTAYVDEKIAEIDIPEQVQADWTQTDDTQADFIKNKPTLGTLASKDKVAKEDLTSDIQEILNQVIITADNTDIDTFFPIDEEGDSSGGGEAVE